MLSSNDFNYRILFDQYKENDKDFSLVSVDNPKIKLISKGKTFTDPYSGFISSKGLSKFILNREITFKDKWVNSLVFNLKFNYIEPLPEIFLLFALNLNSIHKVEVYLIKEPDGKRCLSVAIPDFQILFKT